MSSDKTGRKLKVGDKVTLEFVITSIDEDVCNLQPLLSIDSADYYSPINNINTNQIKLVDPFVSFFESNTSFLGISSTRMVNFGDLARIYETD